MVPSTSSALSRLDFATLNLDIRMAKLGRLHKAAFEFPAIDNHAHPLLTSDHRNRIPFETLISEAEGEAMNDAVHTLACFRATSELGEVLGLHAPSWDTIKSTRSTWEYASLCKKFMDPCKLRCLLLDDGLGGVAELAEHWTWHRQFCSVKRIVRVEIEAERIIVEHFRSLPRPFKRPNPLDVINALRDKLSAALGTYARDADVAGFKSIVCYRTGLDIEPAVDLDSDAIAEAGDALFDTFKTGKVRLAHKPINDLVVGMTLRTAAEFDKPVQFHTGLGDNDITLRRSSPSHMQPIIKNHPGAKIVLLHGSYPYTREAGYLAAVYSNVFLDFGEVFPFVSGQGQRSVIRQVLELCPTNKILWSTDGHWFPESFYLGTIQARQALYDVLSEIVQSGELTEPQAVSIVENALFHNANKLYKLGLQQTSDSAP